MTAPITTHYPAPHPDDDPDHPIPSIAVLDVLVFRKSGGAELTIVIASPLASDERSLKRLLDKIEGYLDHIQSPEFRAEAIAPHSGNTTINVVIHPASASAVFDLLQDAKAWVLANHAKLQVEMLDIAIH